MYCMFAYVQSMKTMNCESQKRSIIKENSDAVIIYKHAH